MQDQTTGYLYHNNRPDTSVVLIVDRSVDPFTPLKTPWTFQAMIHEVFDVRNGLIEENGKKLVLNGNGFFEENKYKHISEFTDVVSKLLLNLSEKEKVFREKLNSLNSTKEAYFITSDLENILREKSIANTYYKICQRILNQVKQFDYDSLLSMENNSSGLQVSIIYKYIYQYRIY